MKCVLGLVLVGVLALVTCAAGEKPNPNILCRCLVGPTCPTTHTVITHPHQCCSWRCSGPGQTMCYVNGVEIQPGKKATVDGYSCKCRGNGKVQCDQPI